jgi:hypothetical protein
VTVPKWFDWFHWGDAIGSHERYRPGLLERRAYVMGLRDAARIVEAGTWVEEPNKRPRRAEGFQNLREAIRRIHDRARHIVRLPPCRDAEWEN